MSKSKFNIDAFFNLDLKRKNREGPNPATYWIETRVECPFDETLFPAAKRKLMRYLSN